MDVSFQTEQQEPYWQFSAQRPNLSNALIVAVVFFVACGVFTVLFVLQGRYGIVTIAFVWISLMSAMLLVMTLTYIMPAREAAYYFRVDSRGLLRHGPRGDEIGLWEDVVGFRRGCLVFRNGSWICLKYGWYTGPNLPELTEIAILSGEGNPFQEAIRKRWRLWQGQRAAEEAFRMAQERLLAKRSWKSEPS